MPPPGPPPFRGSDPNRDYQLLASDDAEAAQQAGKQLSASRLFSLARQEVWPLAAGSFALLVGAAAQVYFPKLAGDLIDVAIQHEAGGSPGEARSRTSAILAQILAVLAISACADGLRSWLFQSAAERVMFRLRTRLFAALLSQEVGFYDRVRTGELTNRLSEDTRMIKTVATSSIVFNLLGADVHGALRHPAPVCALLAVARISRRYVKEQLAASARATTVAEEVFSNIRTVRSFAKEGAMQASFEQAQQRTLQFGLRSAALEASFFPVHTSLATGTVMVVLWWGARLVIDSRLSAGALSAFFVFAVYVAANFGMLLGVFSTVVQDLSAGTQRPAGSPQGGELVLKDVHFAYPSRPGAWVLRGLSLHVAPGNKVALVGPSGGGKSTMVALIERYYDPQSGSVLLDGVPLPAIDHTYLHSQVALVSQEPVLFAASIAENIAFGCPGGSASQEQIEAAARIANAHDFIAGFPQVLLLDEATSALDAESEHMVQEALDRIAAGRTVVVIAHRLSTVQAVDTVAVVEGGCIAEQGTHQQLLEAGGVYAALVRRQLLFASDAPPAQQDGG